MEKLTDEQIGAAIGRLWWEYQDRYTYTPSAENFLYELFLGAEKPWSADGLKVGDEYWIAHSDGVGIRFVWDGGTEDRWTRAQGNCHPTKEAAEAYYKKLMADHKTPVV